MDVVTSSPYDRVWYPESAVVRVGMTGVRTWYWVDEANPELRVQIPLYVRIGLDVDALSSMLSSGLLLICPQLQGGGPVPWPYEGTASVDVTENAGCE